MNGHGEISVVMATYNGERFLAEQLQSIISQTFPPAEIIICDDGSTDGTVAILEEFALKYSFIKIYKNERTLGVVANFKKGVSLTKENTYIAFADQDDIWLPEKLEHGIRTGLLTDNVPATCYSDLEVITESGDFRYRSFWETMLLDKYQHTFDTVLFKNPIAGCTMLMNPEMRRFVADIPAKGVLHDAWLGLCAFTFGNVYKIDVPLVRYRQHDKNITFQAGKKKDRRAVRLMKELTAAIRGENLLKDQMRLVKAFYEQYQAEIPQQKKNMLKSFLSLDNKGYMWQKIALHIAIGK
ncbi:glycosyltransferase [Pedobacter sp. HMF7647]|uniref:Glycosyltransferase n=1 Tax=Hufsiella arboris TaxID=2695275 RepID=A0A7K1YCA1_9SPHI|nr:glycosyltransferase family 2 protein [Hufsiella arboris]MXV51719.1 glycosyltransferase [Hufsiella arboris]